MSYRLIAPAFAAALIPLSLPLTAHAQMQTMNMPGMSAPQQSSRWHIMAHTSITFAADDQQGPRGGSKSFVGGMAMIMASHALNDSTDLDLQAMLSPDAFMGKRGYPLLFQTGETADGVHPLVDRQHPHDLFMGLTATVTHRFGGDMSGFVRVGWPGENGFGPQAFMHRPSGEDFPTAPITHHWFDAGHITMGVAAAGLTKGPVQIEISQFTGREPDEHRFNLERPHLDSTAMRLTWRITPDLTAQGSWAHVISPEELEPTINLIQKSASLAYERTFAQGRLDSTLAFGRKTVDHGDGKPSDAFLFENSFHFKGPWTGLARYERVHNDELVPGNSWWVAKTEIGAIRTFHIGHGATLGLGLVRQFNHVPDSLKPLYGDHPNGTVGFLQLKTHWSSMPDMHM